jgi:RHS repeat-associated protein
LTNDGEYKYYYDCENRLTDVNTTADTRIASYKYDYLGRRIQKTVHSSQNTTKYVYDGDQIIAEYSGDGTLLKKYIYGPSIDEPIMMLVVNGTETRYYYHFDGLGSVVALTDNTGTVVEQYRYDVFGQPNITSTIGNRFMFTGREYDIETENYYYRARYYSPSIGRFLQTDPIRYKDGLNLYTYCRNNPMNWIDPYGLWWGWKSWEDFWDWVREVWKIIHGLPDPEDMKDLARDCNSIKDNLRDKNRKGKDWGGVDFDPYPGGADPNRLKKFKSKK